MQTASPRATVIACAAFVAGAALALFGFGPLDPPNGPIAGTYKTLSEVEPRTAINATNTPGDADSKFKITKPGSYYLTGNLTGVSGKSGIEVTANCTIDLCGFELTGVNGSLDGILLVAEFRGTVRGGQVVNWGGSGIAAEQCNDSLFEDLYLAGNGYRGITIGRDSVISRVRAASNATYGILVDAYCTVSDCVGEGNGWSGIVAATASTVSRCSARSNTDDGIQSAGGTVSDCVTPSNGRHGINVYGGIVRDNVCDANGVDGIHIGPPGGAMVRGNTCSNHVNGSGINCVGSANTVDGNVLRSNNVGIRADASTKNLLIRNHSITGLYIVGADNDFSESYEEPGYYFVRSNPWANFYRE